MNILVQKLFYGGITVPFILHLLECFVLVISLSVDAFAASLAYGADKIKVPHSSAVVISLVCSSALALSMLIGNILRSVIPDQISKWICFIILLIIGLSKFFDNVIKSYIQKHQKLSLNVATQNLKFIFTVYANTKYADLDNSKTLSFKEAAVLAMALSLDSLTVGLGAALSGLGVVLPLILSLLLTFSAIRIGCLLGKTLRRIIPFDLSYLSACLFIVLAVLRLK